MLRDGLDVQAALDTPEARWALRLLESRPLPFSIPSAFVTDPRPGIVQATLAPVFSSSPSVRYRRDTLLSGWNCFPEYRDDEIERAVKVLEHELAETSKSVRFAMPRDALLCADNHRLLHARTAFSDPRRHLLRIRMRDDESENAAAFPMVTAVQSGTEPARPPLASTN